MEHTDWQRSKASSKCTEWKNRTMYHKDLWQDCGRRQVQNQQFQIATGEGFIQT
jgi:hypothetical protein